MRALRPGLRTLVVVSLVVAAIAVARERAFARSEEAFERTYGGG